MAINPSEALRELQRVLVDAPEVLMDLPLTRRGLYLIVKAAAEETEQNEYYDAVGEDI